MTIESLDERLKELQKQFQNAQNRADQAMADMNTIDGAMQEVQYWIKKLEENEKEE
jgi:prefoldin subunit 5